MNDLGKGILYGIVIAIFAMMLIFIAGNVWKGQVNRAAHREAVERTNLLNIQHIQLLTRVATCEMQLNEQSKEAIPQEQPQG